MLKAKTQIRFPTESHVTSYISELSENFCCESYEFGTDIPLTSPCMRTFFKTFGPEVKSLKLHQLSWTGPELWDILSTRLPNLEELSIRIFIPRSGGLLPEPGVRLPNLKILKLNFAIEKPFKSPAPAEVTHPEILKELLLAAPNLEEIYCPIWPTIIRPVTTVSSLFFNVIFKFPEIKFEKLSCIHINAALDNRELFQLMNKEFPLKELRLELYPDVKPYCFYFLLKSLERTLKTLILIFHPDYDAEEFDEFPTLKNLEYLSLHKFCGPADAIVKYLPNLRTLLLNDSYIIDENFGVHQPRFNLNQLQELVIEGRNYSPYGQLKVLAATFPNLIKLRIQNVDDEMLRLIFLRLIHLEELVADGKFTDAGISGIPLETCQNIFEVPDIDKARQWPYIGCLKSKLYRLLLIA
jgi:hypothetical protein